MAQDFSEEKWGDLCAEIDPGICGFPCRIEVRNREKRKVFLAITGSECGQIQEMARLLDEITLQDLFAPVSRNPIFRFAEKAGCHSSCIVPVALLKLAEVAMGMALPKEARIKL